MIKRWKWRLGTWFIEAATKGFGILPGGRIPFVNILNTQGDPAVNELLVDELAQLDAAVAAAELQPTELASRRSAIFKAFYEKRLRPNFFASQKRPRAGNSTAATSKGGSKGNSKGKGKGKGKGGAKGGSGACVGSTKDLRMEAAAESEQCSEVGRFSEVGVQVDPRAFKSYMILKRWMAAEVSVC